MDNVEKYIYVVVWWEDGVYYPQRAYFSEEKAKEHAFDENKVQYDDEDLSDEEIRNINEDQFSDCYTVIKIEIGDK